MRNPFYYRNNRELILHRAKEKYAENKLKKEERRLMVLHQQAYLKRYFTSRANVDKAEEAPIGQLS